MIEIGVRYSHFCSFNDGRVQRRNDYIGLRESGEKFLEDE